VGYLPVVMTRVPPRVSDLVDAMERIAPTRLAAPWDNVGLLVGDGSLPLERVLLTVDLTRPVLEEALHARCSAVIAYHPPLFDATKRFLAGSMAFEAARSGIAVYSPHTALDVADGGTNDVLADVLGLTERAPLRLLDPAESAYKLVTFVPAEHVEAVSRAVFEAGAGHIGQYSSCSFRGPADALREGAEVFLTGELRHHDALKAVAAGMSLVCVRHSTSERVALGALEKRLTGQLPKVSFSVSREDRDPFEFV
jgi:dinuclear metal center YbgI/SA1388 family protein